MFRKIYILFLIISYSSLFPQQANNFNLSQDKEISLVKWSYNKGDSTVWKDLNYKDDKWEIIKRKELVTKTNGIHWLRTKIILTGEAIEFDFLEIFLLNIANAHEVYWDGQLIFSNGKVGNSPESEILGLSISRIKLKRDLCTVGEHLIAIRTSNSNDLIKSNISTIRFGYSSARDKHIQSVNIQSILFIGGYSIAALFTMMLFISNNRFKGYLFLLFAFLLILIFYLKEYFIVITPLSVSLYNYLILSSLWILLAQSLVSIGFILYLFEISRKYLLLIIFICIILICYSTDFLFSNIGYHAVNAIETLYSLGLLIVPYKLGKPGSKLILFGYLLLFLLYFYFFLSSINPIFIIIDPDIPFLIGLFIFWYCLITAVGIKIRIKNQQYEEFRLHSLRLETDLLKKSIQPHFLINTLASIKSLAKRKPDDAEKLINALAAEYRLINKISAEKEILTYSGN